MILLVVGSILTGLAWVYLLGAFTFPVMVTTLALLPLFLFGLGIWAYLAHLGSLACLAAFVLWTISLVILVHITEKLKLSAALIGCARWGTGVRRESGEQGERCRPYPIGRAR